MNARTRTLLAIAMSTALVAPVAFAQKTSTDVKTTGDVTSQATTQKTTPELPQAATQKPIPDLPQAVTQKPTPELPTQTVPRVSDTTDVAAQESTRAADAVDARVAPITRLPVQVGKATEDTGTSTNSVGIPPTAQGAAHAAPHSSVVQRDVWARLDADADGRISATEADNDTTFDGNFAAMDADADGFVSDAEYRTFAKVDTAQGATNAASHSSVVQRATWSRLDADGDGRISAVEADADAGVDGSFSAIDSNSDGFITNAEFRAHAKATSKP